MEDFVETKLKEIICEYVDMPASAINTETSLKCDMGLDSFGLVSLVCNIEETFAVTIPDSELMNFNTFSDMVNYIHANSTNVVNA